MRRAVFAAVAAALMAVACASGAAAQLPKDGDPFSCPGYDYCYYRLSAGRWLEYCVLNGRLYPPPAGRC